MFPLVETWVELKDVYQKGVEEKETLHLAPYYYFSFNLLTFDPAKINNMNFKPTDCIVLLNVTDVCRSETMDFDITWEPVNQLQHPSMQ